MAQITISLTYDLHVKCDLCSFEWVDEDSQCNDKLKCPNCLNTTNYEKIDIRFNTK